jgi:hypothetical protein
VVPPSLPTRYSIDQLTICQLAQGKTKAIRCFFVEQNAKSNAQLEARRDSNPQPSGYEPVAKRDRTASA